MPAVANVRVNTQAPFPTLVTGSGPITIAKNFGIWTVSLSALPLQIGSPTVSSITGQYVLVYDTTVNQFIRFPVSGLGLTARNQRSVTASPIVISTTDQILNININSGSPTCALPPSASRNGVPITFTDVGGHFGSHNLTITPNGSELINGANSLIMPTNFQTNTLVPANDGVNTGWSIT